MAFLVEVHAPLAVNHSFGGNDNTLQPRHVDGSDVFSFPSVRDPDAVLVSGGIIDVLEAAPHCFAATGSGNCFEVLWNGWFPSAVQKVVLSGIRREVLDAPRPMRQREIMADIPPGECRPKQALGHQQHLASPDVLDTTHVLIAHPQIVYPNAEF